VRRSLTWYRALAYATGVFLLLLTLNLVIKYGFDREGLGSWVAVVHGWLYLAYVVVAVDLWLRTRDRAPGEGTEGNPRARYMVKMALVVIAGTVPAMSFVAERWVTARIRTL
jgi:integral membrane protein